MRWARQWTLGQWLHRGFEERLSKQIGRGSDKTFVLLLLVRFGARNRARREQIQWMMLYPFDPVVV